MKPKLAISLGDINGIGLEIALKSHQKISQICTPFYCVHQEILEQASHCLGIKIPKKIKTIAPSKYYPPLCPSKITKESGLYSYESFLKALELTQSKHTQALVTLPIHKKAWQLANISYAGHTEAFRDLFKTQAIMILGSPKLYVALFSDHIPLRKVPDLIELESLTHFLLTLAPHITKAPCGVLGLNPHAGDFGVLGNEETIITQAIRKANMQLKKELFIGPLVPDTAFVGKHLRYYVAMYHDQGLIPLKTLYFKQSINLTLNLPIIRTSVDHGTAFNIAYQNKAYTQSYKNAIKEAILRSKLSLSS